MKYWNLSFLLLSLLSNKAFFGLAICSHCVCVCVSYVLFTFSCCIKSYQKCFKQHSECVCTAHSGSHNAHIATAGSSGSRQEALGALLGSHDCSAVGQRSLCACWLSARRCFQHLGATSVPCHLVQSQQQKSVQVWSPSYHWNPLEREPFPFSEDELPSSKLMMGKTISLRHMIPLDSQVPRGGGQLKSCHLSINDR